MTRRAAPRSRPARDPYGIGPIGGYVGPVVAILALAIIGAVTLSLFNGQIPFIARSVTPGGSGAPGVDVTPAPSNVIIRDPEIAFPGSIVYAKTGNIWLQTGTDVKQLTSTGRDSMPAFSADGQWIYFIRVTETHAKFPTDGFGTRSWYDLDTPAILRMRADGTGAERLFTGKFVQNSSTWFFWLRQPTPSPDGKTIAVISDGPNPLQSDVVLKSYDIASKKLTSLNLPESLHLGHQDPAWRPDGRYLLYVKNARDVLRGAPQIFRYEPATKKTKALTGPGYIEPAYGPDGQWIAATKTDAFGTDIAILDASGKEVLRVTDDGHAFSPVWSPAGDSIAFLHLEGTIVDLKLAKLDRSSGRWTVTDTVDLTKVSGLDGASRPSWFVPPGELPAGSAPSAAPSPSASAAP